MKSITSSLGLSADEVRRLKPSNYIQFKYAAIEKYKDMHTKAPEEDVKKFARDLRSFFPNGSGGDGSGKGGGASSGTSSGAGSKTCGGVKDVNDCAEGKLTNAAPLHYPSARYLILDPDPSLMHKLLLHPYTTTRLPPLLVLHAYNILLTRVLASCTPCHHHPLALPPSSRKLG